MGFVAPEIFRAYDLRGMVGPGFDSDAFYTIGRAFAVQLKAKNRNVCFIARDARLTSESLEAALSQGLQDSGIDVIHLGAVPTPVLYFATHVGKTDSGLMVTGSHNPSEYNGIKMVLAGKTLVDGDIQSLRSVIEEGTFLEGTGLKQTLPIREEYIARIVSDIACRRRFRVVVDCGNGIAGELIPGVLEAIGCEVIPIFCEVDGRFPNHHPDPAVEENLSALKEKVRETKADIGLAFDGDADRLGVVTEKGDVIWPDRLMMLYARSLLKKHQGATIVFDVKCSSHLEHLISEKGGVPWMCPTGHSIVKDVMKQKGALLAGEMSGHLFFKERWYGFDDALYSACRLLEILGESDESVDEIFHSIPNSVNTPEIKIPIEEAFKFEAMKLLSTNASFPEDYRVIQIDGIRVENKNGWGLIRASNTTPCLVARFEADSEEELKTIQSLFREELHRILPRICIPF